MQHDDAPSAIHDGRACVAVIPVVLEAVIRFRHGPRLEQWFARGVGERLQNARQIVHVSETVADEQDVQSRAGWRGWHEGALRNAAHERERASDEERPWCWHRSVLHHEVAARSVGAIRRERLDSSRAAATFARVWGRGAPRRARVA